MIWFLGDVHGRFDHVIRIVKNHRPEAVVFLGDLECSLPLDMILRPILDITEIWFIHGNHDSDHPAYWHNLYGGLAERSLHGRVVEIAGYRVAGLGGTFESQVWLWGLSRAPGAQTSARRHRSDEEAARAFCNLPR